MKIKKRKKVCLACSGTEKDSKGNYCVPCEKKKAAEKFNKKEGK